MKAISLWQPWASMIAYGKKTIETRKWSTSYRGDLLICSTKKPIVDDLPCGKALCIVKIQACVRMSKQHEERACCPTYDGAWAWILSDIRPITPFEVKGSQGFFEVDTGVPAKEARAGQGALFERVDE